MGKRTLMALGLGLVLLMGVAALAATVNNASAHSAVSHAGDSSGVQAAPNANQPANIHAAATPTEAGDQAGDGDPNAPCATDAQGNQTGNCQDSQNSSGPQDNGAGG